MRFKSGDRVRIKKDSQDAYGFIPPGCRDVIFTVDKVWDSVLNPGESYATMAELLGCFPYHDINEASLEPVQSVTLCADVPDRIPMILSTDATERKGTPICTGVVDYFPRALAEVAKCSKAGNDQHNPGQPLHWAIGKSTDHSDCIMRHLIDRDTVDTDGIQHDVKLAWRALALLETRIRKEQGLI